MEDSGREKVKGWFEREATWVLLKHVKVKRPYKTMDFNSNWYKVGVLNRAMSMFMVVNSKLSFILQTERISILHMLQNLVLQETHFALSLSKKSESRQYATFKSSAQTRISKQIVFDKAHFVDLLPPGPTQWGFVNYSRTVILSNR